MSENDAVVGIPLIKVDGSRRFSSGLGSRRLVVVVALRLTIASSESEGESEDSGDGSDGNEEDDEEDGRQDDDLSLVHGRDDWLS